MDFNNIKHISISSKYIKNIKRKIDGELLWTCSPHTNMIPISTDYDLHTIYNGIGISEGRWSASSDKVNPTTGYGTTGLIPAKPGDIIRVKGFNYISGSQVYAIPIIHDGTNYTVCPEFPYSNIPEVTQAGYVSPGYMEFSLDKETYGDFNYIRICLRGLTSNSVITINEPIIA